MRNIDNKSPTQATPPWLDGIDPIGVTARFMAQALPSRRFPGPPPDSDGEASWQRFARLAALHIQLTIQGSDGPFKGAVAEAAFRIDQAHREGSFEADVILLGVEVRLDAKLTPPIGSPFLDSLVAGKGLPYAVDVLLALEQAGMAYREDRPHGWCFVSNTGTSLGSDYLSPVELRLRTHLAHADQATWDRCAQTIEAAVPRLVPERQPLLGVLLPERPAFSDQLARALCALKNGPSTAAWLLLTAQASDVREALLQLRPSTYRYYVYPLWYDKEAALATVLRDHGAEAPALMATGAVVGATARVLASIGTPAAITALARAGAEEKPVLKYLAAAAKRWPLAAMPALAELLASEGKKADASVRAALDSAVSARADAVPAMQAWVSAPAWALLVASAAQVAQHIDEAAAAELPPVLANPPWLAAPGTVDEALARFPDKIPKKLPDFWQPATWTRPQLAPSGKALPLAAVDHLGTMLRFPQPDKEYAGITQIKQYCSAASLDAFMWDAFEAWTLAGAPTKDNWVFRAIGLIGGDDCARKLTALIRKWPADNQITRSIAGLDILARIGNDTALMLLHGIAQKIKYLGLKDRAADKIEEIAEARGLSPEELEDRLVPDLGLDEQGGLLLDFGPRQFRVGFDEALKPFVRAHDGKRLADLPKPNQSDDATLSGAAVARYKALKKNARTIAAQQVLRLETAMCNQRRWPLATFQRFLAGHPVLRHLVQRLVWGVYDADGKRLLSTFRVAADRSLTDAQDDAVTLPPGQPPIGLPHPLDLAPGVIERYRQLFADYQLLQPFEQIERGTWFLSSEEAQANELQRWQGVKLATGELLGLPGRGWRSGGRQEGGRIVEFSRTIGDVCGAQLQIEPGVYPGIGDDLMEQTLHSVTIGAVDDNGEFRKAAGLAQLDPVAVSEFIRDIERLRI